MFKSNRWRSEKSKIKAVFKLHFRASQVPKSGWETLMVVLIPTDVGRPTVRSDKATVTDGSCGWINAVYETVKFSCDAKTGRVHDKIYQFIISAPGSNKGGILGEASVNLGDYAEAFKPSNVTLPLKGNSGAVLHVTIQRMVGDDEGRENENGEITVKPRRRTLQSQLSKCDDEDAKRARNGIDFEDGSVVVTNEQSPMKFASSRNLPLKTDPPIDTNLQKSHSFDAISPSDSDNNSSGRFAFTPRGKENNTMHNNTSYVSPLSQIETPQKLLTSSGDWSASTDGSTSNSVEAAGSQDSEENVEKLRGEVVALTRKVDLSEMELQTLRKQIAKESRRAHDFFKEMSTLKEERDGFKRECEELKRRGDGTAKLGVQGENPWVTLEEVKRELSVERSSNSSLRLQLQKLQESNSELLLEIRDLDEMMEERNREILCLKADTSQILVPDSEQGGDERCTLDVLIKKNGGLKVTGTLEKKIVELANELELYKKDREDMEMQMEQLALDYEILKQENHDVTTKLEQTQLREQLRMQYECSAHLAVISELESHVESLEREITEQNEAFEAELASLMDQKVEQEKRAIKAEEALRKARWSSSEAAERLQDEFKTLYTQVTSMFDSNEKLVLEARRETAELKAQKREMEEHLEKKQEELGSVHSLYKVKVQQLLSLVEFKSKEIDELVEQLKSKTQELENMKNLRDEMIQVRTEMVKVATEKEEALLAEMEELKALNEEKENNLQGKIMEVEMLAKEIRLLREEANVSMEKIRNEKETSVSELMGEIEPLRTRCSELERSLLEMKSENENLANLNGCGYNKVIQDMASLKERNDLMEEELKEMQERYSEISLKFAEVEGERQQLVMRIRSLKNAMKN